MSNCDLFCNTYVMYYIMYLKFVEKCIGIPEPYFAELFLNPYVNRPVYGLCFDSVTLYVA